MRRFAILLLGTVLGIAHAQTTLQEPAALTKLRAQFEQRVRTAAAPFNGIYETRLGQEEAAFVTAGDYEQARVAKARRAELLAQSADSATAAAAPPVALPLAAARTYGAVSLKSNELQGWRTTSCAADWTLSSVTKFTPGSYQVVVTYTLKAREPDLTGPKRIDAPTPAESVSYVFREISLLASGGRNQAALTFTTSNADPQEATGSAPIELSRTPVTLRLAATQSYPANVVVIKDVKLVPVVKPAPEAVAAPTDTTSPPSLVAEFTALCAAFPGKLASARSAIVANYTAKLEALAAAAPKDEALADAVENELQRAKRLPTDLRLRTDQRSRWENFDELAGAQFVPDPTNTGDTFKVSHGGTTQRVRLAFVVSPPMDPGDSKAMKLVLDRFAITSDQALALARSAQEFTAFYLEGRSLNLLVRHHSKSGQPAEALVFIDDIGLYQGVLLDHGLALLDPNATSNGRGTGTEANDVKALRDREERARKQLPRPGGWGLSATSKQ